MTAENDTNRQRIYDWWSCHPWVFDRLYDGAFLGREDAFRQWATETLDLTRGECVLEVGCGTGNSFCHLFQGVGSDGTVVGLDASRGMVHAARRRILPTTARNFHIVRSDARRPPFSPGTFNAAYAAMSLSAVSDPKRAIDAVETVLRRGGRFVVLDAQPFQRWPWWLANPLVGRVATRTTNWEPRVDLPAALQHTFETIAVETFNAGSIFVACARKR